MIPEELLIKTIEKVYQQIKPYIKTTPLIKANNYIDDAFNSNIYLKYECFQKSGSFKARGAINNILSSNEKDLENGITAVSAGNHAIAASYAANIFNLKKDRFMIKHTCNIMKRPNPFKITISPTHGLFPRKV